MLDDSLVSDLILTQFCIDTNSGERDMQILRQTYRYRETNIQTGMQARREAGRQTIRQTDRRGDRQRSVPHH